MNRRNLLVALAALFWSGGPACLFHQAKAQEAKPDFARDVLPIFQRSCFGCHGPEKQKSGYRLDVRENALKGGDFGEAAIVPHDSAKSPMFRYVSGTDKSVAMPPVGSEAPRLSPEEVALIKKWIDTGPNWPDEFAGAVKDAKPQWSLQPLVKPALPEGAKHPIDAFVAARLAKSNLAPGPAADRRTLIRRVTYDLTGLAPTPEEVEAFVSDTRPEAYDAIVTRLLDSPRYGEHWGRHWLDVAHYADTHGNDHDYARPNAWPYRDYVIRAFNEDKPYARFVEEQVAADALFAKDDPRSIVALGFLAAGPWDDTLMVTVREDTYDHKISQVLDRDDMVTTVMSTFQSLTVHCARCHNHKFDPISQRDYYALQAVFAGVDKAERPVDTDWPTYERRRKLLARKASIERKDPAIMESLSSPETLQKVAAFEESVAKRESLWEPLDVSSVVSAGGHMQAFTRQADGSWLVSGETPESDAYIVTATLPKGDVRALRLEALPDDSLPNHGPGRYRPTGNFHLAEFRVDLQPAGGEGKDCKNVEFYGALADHSDIADTIANAIDGNADTYWSVHPLYGQRHEAVFTLRQPLEKTADGAALKIRLQFGATKQHQLGHFRLTYCTSELAEDQRPPLKAKVAEWLRKGEAKRSAKQYEGLALYALDADVDGEMKTLPTPQIVYAAANLFAKDGSFKPAAAPRPIFLLTRGDLNKPEEMVGPGALRCVAGMSGDLAIEDLNDEAARRAALARWLTDERNGLTWRSIVNRVWHYHFGRGLCDSPNDFGKMGSDPSHPELLDWLAVWFRDDAKGSLKALHRLIVTSATYRQASAGIAEAAAIDGDNRLLARMNRNRLTAEEIRDSVLQFSGQLDLTMGGPAVMQFVDHGRATFNTDGSPPFVDYENFSPDAAQNRRRSVYRFVFRTVPDPLMDALDAPDGGALTPVRNQSTTAVQAFALLNNPFLIRQCEHIAERVAKQGATPEEQVVALFRLLLQRAPRPDESERFSAYVRKHGLANACQVLLNSNELIYLD